MPTAVDISCYLKMAENSPRLNQFKNKGKDVNVSFICTIHNCSLNGKLVKIDYFIYWYVT